MNTMLRETLQKRHRARRPNRWLGCRGQDRHRARNGATPGSSATPRISSPASGVGNDDNSPMDRVSGGNVPAAIFGDFMADAHTGATPASLPGNYQFRNPDGFMTTPIPPQNIADVINNGGVAQPYGAGGTAVVPPPPAPATPARSTSISRRRGSRFIRRASLPTHPQGQVSGRHRAAGQVIGGQGTVPARAGGGPALPRPPRSGQALSHGRFSPSPCSRSRSNNRGRGASSSGFFGG